MMIAVSHLKKNYQVWQKEAGLLGSFKSLLNRQSLDVKAVDDLSFSIKEGELVGFIGPNGAGKTTTLKVLSGLLYPTSGEVSVAGFTPYERQTEFLKNISLVMGQKNQLWWDLPPMETFLLNKEIYQIPDAQFEKTLTDLTRLLEIKDLLKVPTRRLSLGERMKCELVAALLHSPKVLFLDEPTIGLDVISQKKIRDFLADYNRLYKATIILTSHYMGDVQELAERVVIIDKGKLIYDGNLQKLVEKYAGYKLLSVIFSHDIDAKKLQKIGEIKKYEYPKALISVPRGVISLAASELLRDFPVADLLIEEPAIEDIIRQVFSHK
ncbi:MAG: ABC transporter ATP-binding protein [Patescibacteria group bacterium]|nr:ABC transporter ATP-binding protein [Patescibacteria group bacterium]MCL5095538.1 ABC transporter ATP-binding protein [Patescibacteria group bacterium]